MSLRDMAASKLNWLSWPSSACRCSMNRIFLASRSTQKNTPDGGSATVDEADAFVFVTPEYNHGPPASLVNALSYLHHEWHYKPVGFVSYGGVSAGTRSVEMTKQIVTTLKMMPHPRGGLDPVRLPAR
jgi:NADPH-dependent FMN reductase